MIGTWALFGAVLVAGAPDAVARDFEAGNERALTGDVAQASALYRSILERGYEDADVYYNLGHVLEESAPLEAIIAYERGLSLDPGDAEARGNLDALRARFAPKAPARPEGTSDGGTFATTLRNVAPTAAWAAALLCLAAGLLSALRGPKGRGGAGLLLTAGLLALGWVALAVAFSPPERAVVTAASKLREGPDARFGVRGGVVAGETVRIEDRDGAFVEVRRLDGTSGWLQASSLAEI
ncbi:MAG: SH3 domain-containing protein [Myxococcota bacterium]